MTASDSRPAHANTAQRRTILDAIPAIAWCKLPDGSNEFVNQRWQDYTGIPADEARGQGWQAAVHPEDLPKLSEQWAYPTPRPTRVLTTRQKWAIGATGALLFLTTAGCVAALARALSVVRTLEIPHLEDEGADEGHVVH